MPVPTASLEESLLRWRAELHADMARLEARLKVLERRLPDEPELWSPKPVALETCPQRIDRAHFRSCSPVISGVLGQLRKATI